MFLSAYLILQIRCGFLINARYRKLVLLFRYFELLFGLNIFFSLDGLFAFDGQLLHGRVYPRHLKGQNGVTKRFLSKIKYNFVFFYFVSLKCEKSEIDPNRAPIQNSNSVGQKQFTFYPTPEKWIKSIYESF